MTPPDSTAPRRDNQSPLRRQVQRLRAAVYAQPDPTANPDLLAELSLAEGALRAEEAAAGPVPTDAPAAVAPAGRMLGPNSTQLKVEPTLNMHPVPTAIYPLLDPDTDPLLTVAVSNLSLNAGVKRVCVRAWIEGLSAECVRTVELPRGAKAPVVLKLLPLLFPERVRLVTEVQRATLHLRVDDLDGKPESHDTFPLVLLARTSGFNAAADPATGLSKDLTHYYGSWVTPYAEPVQALLRVAAGFAPAGQLLGYLRGGGGRVRDQVAAVYRALKEHGVAYVHSVTDYGAPRGTVTQRTRLPREALDRKSANCIDGAVLFASLLEGASLNAALLLVPGHALAGWEAADGSGEWRFVETTMVGTDDFDAACASGQRQYEKNREMYPESLRLHPLAALRDRGIWPME
ncbi:MAG TPA: hypothetical protein VD866_13310 [Urbifossiella sp.]|nr:hypothetical protein [Urbifossiella sp.]